MAEQTTIPRALDGAPATQAASHPDTYEGVSPIKANKLGHLVYEVSDVERTVRFWTEVMGLIETDRNEHGMVFFRCGADHHAIGLKPATAGRRPDPGAALKVDHLAFEGDNVEMLFAARDYLKRNGIPVVFEGRKGAGGNVGLHLTDPDGYEFELYCGMDQVDETGRTRPPEQFHRVKSLEDAIANPLPKTW